MISWLTRKKTPKTGYIPKPSVAQRVKEGILGVVGVPGLGSSPFGLGLDSFFTFNDEALNGLLKQLEKRIIIKIDAARTPLSQVMKTALGAVGNNFSKRLKQSEFDDLYHLCLIFTLDDGKSISYEKTTTPDIRVNPVITSDTELLDIPVDKIGLLMSFKKHIEYMGRTKYETYNGVSNNCQDFVISWIKANALSTPQIETWVKQDTSSLFIDEDIMEQRMLNITDTGAVVAKYSPNFLARSGVALPLKGYDDFIINSEGKVEGMKDGAIALKGHIERYIPGIPHDFASFPRSLRFRGADTFSSAQEVMDKLGELPYEDLLPRNIFGLSDDSIYARTLNAEEIVVNPESLTVYNDVMGEEVNAGSRRVFLVDDAYHSTATLYGVKMHMDSDFESLMTPIPGVHFITIFGMLLRCPRRVLNNIRDESQRVTNLNMPELLKLRYGNTSPLSAIKSSLDKGYDSFRMDANTYGAAMMSITTLIHMREDNINLREHHDAMAELYSGVKTEKSIEYSSFIVSLPTVGESLLPDSGILDADLAFYVRHQIFREVISFFIHFLLGVAQGLGGVGQNGDYTRNPLPLNACLVIDSFFKDSSTYEGLRNAGVIIDSGIIPSTVSGIVKTMGNIPVSSFRNRNEIILTSERLATIRGEGRYLEAYSLLESNNLNISMPEMGESLLRRYRTGSGGDNLIYFNNEIIEIFDTHILVKNSTKVLSYLGNLLVRAKV